MRKIQIDNDEHQEFVVPFEGNNVNIVMNFRQGSWFMSVSYKNKAVNGIRVASAVLLLMGLNLPFDIIVDDKNLLTDPFSVDSFSSGLFDFYFIDRYELAELRGYKVE